MTHDQQIQLQGQNQHWIEKRSDAYRRHRVCVLAAQAFNREVVHALHHGTVVDPGELWDACVAAAVKDTEWSVTHA